MKQINGNTFTVSMVLDFEFTLGELDELLQCGTEDDCRNKLQELMQHKTTCDAFGGSYNPEQVLKAGSQKLLEVRRQGLRALNPPPAETA